MLRRAKTQGSRAGLREELPRASVRWGMQKVGHIEPFDGRRSAASSSSGSYPGIQQAQRRRDSIWSNASHESQDTQGDDDIYARDNPLLAGLLSKLSVTDYEWTEPPPLQRPDSVDHRKEQSAAEQAAAGRKKKERKHDGPRFLMSTASQEKYTETNKFLYGSPPEKKNLALKPLSRTLSRLSLKPRAAQSSTAPSQQSPYDGDRSLESLGDVSADQSPAARGGTSSGSPATVRAALASLATPTRGKSGDGASEMKMQLSRPVKTTSKIRLPGLSRGPMSSAETTPSPASKRGSDLAPVARVSSNAGDVPGYLRMTKAAEKLKEETALEQKLFSDGCMIDAPLFDIPDPAAKFREPRPPRVVDVDCRGIMEYAVSGMRNNVVMLLDLAEGDMPLPLVPRWDPHSRAAHPAPAPPPATDVQDHDRELGGLIVSMGGTKVERVRDVGDGWLGITAVNGFTYDENAADGARQGGSRRRSSLVNLVPLVPERFTFVVEQCEEDDGEMYIGLAAAEVDPDNCQQTDLVSYRSNGIIRVFGQPHEAAPPYETGDVVMVDYLAAQGVAYFLLNGRKVSSEMPFRRAMKPWVGLGTKGMAVSTGEKLPGKVDKGVCDWCFTVLGEKGGTAPCSEGGDSGGQYVSASGEKLNTKDILALKDENVDSAVWVPGKLRCCNCVHRWGQFEGDSGATAWYSEYGCHRCKARQGWSTEGGVLLTHNSRLLAVQGESGDASRAGGGQSKMQRAASEEEEAGMERKVPECDVEEMLFGHSLRPVRNTSLLRP